VVERAVGDGVVVVGGATEAVGVGEGVIEGDGLGVGDGLGLGVGVAVRVGEGGGGKKPPPELAGGLWVVKALTSLQSLWISPLIALTFQ
jgi:hypothetical protein